jgi:hypothetical protein
MAVAVVLLSVVFAGPLVEASPASAATPPPAQFIAKMYTEALGRMPEAGGWAANIDAYGRTGCTLDAIRQSIRGFYLSTEFLGLHYGNAARVLALYRGAVNREPEQGAFDVWTSQLDRGEKTWAQVVDGFGSSAELASLASRICSGSASYYYGTQPAPTLATSGAGFVGGTGEQLQRLLDSAPAGGTVYLAQMAVVRLTTTLFVPAGKTLATVGLPTPNEYANQGRLVRSSSFETPMVQLSGGARLLNVWVDGQRGDYKNYTGAATNVQTMGGLGTEVSGSKISNSMGWTSLVALGSFEGWPCASTTIQGNLVTAYSSEHLQFNGRGPWTDGLSVACEHATVQNNAVVDATDVGIVLFRASPATQASMVRNNQILSAGNSAYGALVIDGVLDQHVTHDFTGTTMTGNAFWTGPNTHFDIGMSIGTRPWFGNRSDAGTGAAVTNNTTNGLTAIVGTGIALSGMYNATVQGNNLTLSVRAVSSCPHVNLAVDADGYAAGGKVQSGGTSVSFTNPSTGGGCIGH